MPKSKGDDLSLGQQKRKRSKRLNKESDNESDSDVPAKSAIKVELNDQLLSNESGKSMKTSLLLKLGTWAEENKRSKDSLISLISILREEGHDLPDDVSTFFECYKKESNSKLVKSENNEQTEGFMHNSENNENTHEEDHAEHTCCGACRKDLKLINEKIDYLINMSHCKSQSYGSINIDSEIDSNLLPELPMKTVEDVRAFDTSLKNNGETREQFAHMVIQIGGINEKRHLRNILSACFTDDLACQISWTGHKQRQAVKNTKIIKVIVGAMEHIYSSFDVTQIHQRIQDWFRHAGDRWRYHNITKVSVKNENS